MRRVRWRFFSGLCRRREESRRGTQECVRYEKEDSKCNLRSAGASLELAVFFSNPRIAIRCSNGIRNILDLLTKVGA